VIGLGLIMGFDPRGGVLGIVAAVALVLVFAFALSWVWTTLGLILRTPNAGDEHRLRDPLPNHLHEQHPRRPRHYARLAARSPTSTRSATSPRPSAG
jgi:hypothetical protein